MNHPFDKPEFSLVIPCYNEEEVLPLLKARLRRCLPEIASRWEVVFVDDGSTDRTDQLLAEMNREDARFKVVSFSRNFGHQMAVLAGLTYVRGEAVGIMDADLQDPPELFAQYLDKLNEGYDVVYAIRRQRKENAALRAAFFLFYRLLNLVSDTAMPLDAGDFCVMRRKVVTVLTQMPERNMFLRGLRAWVGFRQTGLEYNRGARAGGRTKYSLRKLVRLAFDGITAFSAPPFHLAVELGILALCGASGLLVYGCLTGGSRFAAHSVLEPSAWAVLGGVVCLVGGLQLVFLGWIGVYVSRIRLEIRQRPRWIIRDELGFESPQSLSQGEARGEYRPAR